MFVDTRLGDLAAHPADVLVNAANSTLLGGGGVDGALHRGAGPRLLEECRALPLVGPGVRCRTGDARATRAHGLPARWVVHTVGPVYGRDPEPQLLLARALRGSLALAVALGARTVAAPALSCGAFRYPVDAAARVLVGVARERAWPLERLTFVLFDEGPREAFARASTRAPTTPHPPEPPAFRRAEAHDEGALAAVIREVMPTFGASGPGFAITDPEVDHLATAYGAARHVYFVVEQDGVVVGGAGIGPLAAGEPTVCELRKMYLLPRARGAGLGERLLRQCLVAARGFGYSTCYLETLTTMHAAMRLYERLGFERLGGPLGRTGHTGCDRFYALDLGALDPAAPPG